MRYEPKRIDRKEKKTPCLRTFGVILIILTIALTAFFFLYGLCHVDGKSMDPNLANGDLLVYRRGADIERGNIVVIRRADNSLLIKRVIGLPSDTVEITTDGAVLINGQAVSLENIYILGQTEPHDWAGQITLGENQYFVLGDNRPVSKDSRSKEVGLVQGSAIVGVVKISIRLL